MKTLKVITEPQILGLSERLPQFFDNPFLVPTVSENSLKTRLLTGSIEDTLKKNAFLIHKICYDRYNQPKLDRLRSKRRKISVCGRPSGSTDTETATPARLKSESNIIALGELVCMFCREGDKFNPKRPETANWKLCASGAKLQSSKYVESYSEELRRKASLMGDTDILVLLDRDVRAGELYSARVH